MRVDADSIIGDILDAHPACAAVFSGHGMQCTGCPSARGETLEEACEVHGASLDTLINDLKQHMQGS